MRLPTKIHLEDFPGVQADLAWRQEGNLALAAFRGVHLRTYGGETSTQRVSVGGHLLGPIEFYRTPEAALRSIGWLVVTVSDVEIR